MFVGDGPPRRSVNRPWDWSLPSSPYWPNNIDYVNDSLRTPSDRHCLQIREFVNRFDESHMSEGEPRFYCPCAECWFPIAHRCRSTALTMPVRPAHVPPRGWFPWDWVFRNNFPNDRVYVNGDTTVGRVPIPAKQSTLTWCSINSRTRHTEWSTQSR